MQEDVDYLTVAEVAEAVGITGSGVRDRIRRGKLPAVKAGRSYRVAASSLMESEGLSRAVAVYLCRFLTHDLTQKMPELFERQAMSFATAELKAARQREVELGRRLGHEQAMRETAEAEVERLRQDVAALALELRESGVRGRQQTTN